MYTLMRTCPQGGGLGGYWSDLPSSRPRLWKCKKHFFWKPQWRPCQRHSVKWLLIFATVSAPHIQLLLRFDTFGKEHTKIIWNNMGKILPLLGHVYGKIMEMAQKLRRIILFQFALKSCRCNCGENRKTLMSMISGFPDVSPSPKTNII